MKVPSVFRTTGAPALAGIHLSPAVVRPSWESSLPFAIAAGSRLFVERPSCDSRSACSGDEAPTPCAVTTEGRPRSRTGPQAKRLQVHS
jgi:hypothetical protein